MQNSQSTLFNYLKTPQFSVVKATFIVLHNVLFISVAVYDK